MYNFGGGGGTEFDSRGATESIADLNPEDIESMSVLTGAAAAALYESRERRCDDYDEKRPSRDSESYVFE